MAPFTMSFMWLLHQSECFLSMDRRMLFARTLESVCSAAVHDVSYVLIVFFHVGVERVETVAGKACTVNCSFRLSSKKCVST